MQSTLLEYLTNSIHLSHPNFYFGLTSAGMVITPILFGSLIARYVDDCKNIKLFAIICNIVFLVGCCIYVLPNSPIFPFIGRTLQGFTLIYRGLIYSEVARVYPKDEINNRTLLLLLAYGVGELIGALLMKALEKANIFIGGLHVVYGNVSPLVLALITTVNIPIIILYAHDLSKEFDLKAYQQAEMYSLLETNYLCSGDTEIDDTERMKSTCSQSYSWFDKLQRNFGADAALLLAIQFYSGLWMSLITITIPYTMEMLHYNNTAIDVAYTVIAVAIVIVSLALYKITLSRKAVYYCGIIDVCSIVLLITITCFISEDLPDMVNYILLAANLLLCSILYVSDNTFVIVTLGNLFDSSNQSLVESIRMMAFFAGVFVGSLLSGYLYATLTNLIPLYIILALFFLTCLIVRKDTLSNPQIILRY